MKQSLQLKLSQQLRITPQLQQAIRLLQLSTLDLQQEIQQALDSNPLLEESEPEDDLLNQDDDQPQASSAAESDGPLENLEHSADDNRNEETDWDTHELTMPDELPVDVQWEDLLSSSSAPTSPSQDYENVDDGITASRVASESLREQLLWQLSLTRLSDTDRLIALSIIDATDDNGRLILSVEDICDSLTHDLDIDIEEVIAVLHRLQQFEPCGICARNLQECLQIQLDQLPSSTAWLPQAKQVLSRYLSQLATTDYEQIRRRMRLKEHELKAVLALLQSLNPNPGHTAVPKDIEYVIPDIYVSKKNERWRVELNPDIIPTLRINASYANLVTRGDAGKDNTYLRDNLQEARWFLKSLQSRNETLLKVARKIVEHQRNFLEYGAEAMKPLVLQDIAEAIDMHESTISRATTNKYLHTPRGIFELKYFFSSHVPMSSGGECSSTAIKALLKKLVAAESPCKPLSDSKITLLMNEQGIEVARRTITKYREKLFIAPSSERKRLV
ncbi:MAG: RNA polymerase factor sigma-54 [Halioglobus sp.]|nr:RNA polymerase factor sigma-54 [Halioglobus sp.]